MRRSATLVPLAILIALLLVTPAAAHANLVRSEPIAGATLQAAPKEILLEFSEDLDRDFSRVQLLDSAHQIVAAGPGAIDPAAPRVLRLALGDLPTGSYTAIWRARSAEDGHVTEGTLPFGVGVGVAPGALIPPPGTPDPATVAPPPLDSAVRWLDLLLAAVMLGGLPFGLFVWRPALRAARADGLADRAAAADESMARATRRMLLAGGGLFLLANLLFLLVQTADAAGVPIGPASGAPVVRLLGGRTGQLWLARVALTLALGALAWRLPPAGRGPAWPWQIGLALGGGVLLTFSLNAHGAAAEQGAPFSVALDWLHIAATVAWLGGLVPLTIAVRMTGRATERALPLALLVPRFSRLAAVCIAILTLTGIYSYALHVGGLDLLAATTYGRALLAKLALFGLLLLLGGLNLFVLSPQLRAGSDRLARALGRNVRLELIAGALVLLAAAAMTSVAPSKIAWEAHEQLGPVREATVGDVDLVLHVAPGRIGDNEFAVDVTDRRPGAQVAPANVLLLFDMVGMDVGKLQTETRAAGTQRYTARGSFVSMGGRWDVEVVLRRPGFDDVRHTFQLDIVLPPESG